MGRQILHRGEDLSHTGLVVGAQQGGAVGNDEVLPHILGQAGKFRSPHDNTVRERNVSALIMDYLGVNIGAGSRGRSVHVGDEAQAGNPLAAHGSGQPAIDVAVLIHLGPVKAKLGELLGQSGP